jgi:hypothetical protein
MRLAFGATDVSLAVRGGSISQSLDSRGELRVTLDPAAFPADPVDYLARLEAGLGHEPGTNRFVGHASRVTLRDDGLLELEASGVQVLVETLPGQFEHLDVSTPEVVYAIARSAGMVHEELFIPALDALTHEIFEVIAPVHGVVVSDRLELSGVTLLPREAVLERLAELGFSSPPALSGADAFALGLQTARLVYDAEEAGLRQIDLALDWLTTRLRYAIAAFPTGQVQPFDRAERRAIPRRGQLVVVRGLLSGRRWMRAAAAELKTTTAGIIDNDPLINGLPENSAASERLALAACRRAVADTDPLARVQAIWEAVEFIVAGVAVPRRWAPEDLQAIADALPKDLPHVLLARARDAIADLNQVPLMARLRHVIECEGLPCSDAEIALLAALRRVRNDAGHGRDARVPSRDELDEATAVICRLAVVRLTRRSRG